MQEWYHLAAYFIIYAFLGWVLEVVYHAVTKGQVVNRGFLNGPICPIYGCGMVSILTLLMPVSRNIVLLTIGGTVLATLIELVGGFVLLKIFHMRWWDYSDQPFNLGGYVCPRFSLAWGVCILLAVKIIHPFIELNVNLLDGVVGYIIVAAAYVIFIIDVVCTVLTVLHLNDDLEQINRVSADLRRASDELTQTIADNASETAAKVQEKRVQAALGKAELKDMLEENLKARAQELRARSQELKEKAEELRTRSEEAARREVEEALETAEEARRADEAALHIAELKGRIEQSKARLLKRHPLGYRRLMKAFPRMSSVNFKEELSSVIEDLEEAGDGRKGSAD